MEIALVGCVIRIIRVLYYLILDDSVRQGARFGKVFPHRRKRALCLNDEGSPSGKGGLRSAFFVG